MKKVINKVHIWSVSCTQRFQAHGQSLQISYQNQLFDRPVWIALGLLDECSEHQIAYIHHLSMKGKYLLLFNKLQNF